jgi:hypothetical protein
MQSFDETDLDDLPPTLHEQEVARNRVVIRANERRERARVRAANAKRGFSEPTPGDTLFVQLDGSITRRTRSGVRFERYTRIEVQVVEGTEEEVKAKQVAKVASGGVVDFVSVLGAEYIIEDMALHVYESPAATADVQELERRKAAVEEELKVSRAENARLQEALRKERKARQSAVDTGTGAPNRLQAAAAAREAAGHVPPPADQGDASK